MIETAMACHTPVTDFLHMPFGDFLAMRHALNNVLERQKENKPEAGK